MQLALNSSGGSSLFATFAIGISLTVLAPVEAATIIYAIDPARSQLSGSGNVRNITLTPQTQASLTDAIQGWLSAQWHDTGLTFTGGSRIVAMPHPQGPFVPSAAEAGSGSMVDNFGVEGRVLGARVFSAAIRDAVGDIESGAASFGGPVSDLSFGFVDGTIDYHDGSNDEFGWLDLTKLLPVKNAGSGNLVRTVESKLDTITLPVFVDFPFEFLEPNDSRLRLHGQIVATSPVLTIEAGTLTNINSKLNLTALHVEEGATVRVTAEPLVTQSLRMADAAESASTLDLNNVATAMIVDYLPGLPTPAADVRNRIIAGRGNTELIGAWNGKGITSVAAQADPSSLSVGWAVNADLPLGPYATFRGQTVDPTSVLIRATRIGDANLDGVVDNDDVTIVGATFGMTSGAVWALGDFDYDGDVDDNDVTLLGALYDPNAQPVGGVAAPNLAEAVLASPSLVPEPATILLSSFGFAAAGLLVWRRRGSAR